MKAFYIVRKHFASLPSTNSTAKEFASSGQLSPDALSVFTCDEQTAGRGRLGRLWTSGRDDIKATFAFLVPPHVLPYAYQLSPLLALVACRVIQRHAIADPLRAHVSARIKWPNDILVGDCRKVGGILCELESTTGGNCWAALGLGLNVNSMPDDLGIERANWPLSTLKNETKEVQWDVSQILDDLCKELVLVLQQFLAVPNGAMRSGFVPFLAEYESLSVLMGKNIRFNDGETPVEGRVTRIGEDGRLYIKTKSDKTQSDASNSNAIEHERGFLSGEVTGVEIINDEGATLIEGRTTD